MVPQEYIFELTQRSDIVDIISGYVQLRHQGRTHKGLCPFHSEKSPSFVVYPDTQSFYCFGCGAGGDAIGFTKRINNVDYIEAVKLLASRVGMPMPDDNDKTGSWRQRLTSINKDAARFYFDQLSGEGGAIARSYWRGRGLSDSTIRKFGLGYAPDSFQDTLEALNRLGYTNDELVDAGFVKRSEKGHYYDNFRNRVMVPIFDLRGNVIAFGGRNLGNEKPKYINSPETLLYKKSQALFALNLAKKSSSKRYILCEGYMDVIALHQAGFTTAVAACGTALTQQQVKMISDYADEVVLCYDSDEAGQKATVRSIELFSSSPVKLTVLTVPDAKDPDEFIKRFGAERFEQLLKGGANAIEYELVKAKAKYKVETADGRLAYVKEAINILSGRVTPTERDVYAGRLSEETDIAKTAIINQLDAAIRQRTARAQKERQRKLLDEGVGAQINVSYSQGGTSARGVVFCEQQLVASLIKNPDFISLAAQGLTPDSFIGEETKEVFTLLLNRQNQRQYIDLTQLSIDLSEKSRTMLPRILAQNHEVTIERKDVEDFISRIQQSLPTSARAGEKSPQELMEYVEKLKLKKT